MIYKELPRVKHIREDGWLSELVSMNYDDQPFHSLHSYVVTIYPGKSRANHYHRKKEEWAALAAGRIALLLENINTGEKEKLIIDVNSEDYKIVYIPPLVAHTIINIGTTNASLIVFSKNPEDKEDTIPFEVK